MHILWFLKSNLRDKNDLDIYWIGNIAQSISQISVQLSDCFVSSCMSTCVHFCMFIHLISIVYI